MKECPNSKVGERVDDIEDEGLYLGDVLEELDKC